MTRADVLIVGGGVIGCALARELALRKRSVTLVERGEVGQEASSVAAGLLSPQADSATPGPFFDLCLASRELFPEWATHLEEETGIAVGYRRTGILRYAFDDPTAEGLLASRRWQSERGLVIERLTAEEIARLAGEPPPAGIEGALLFPRDGTVQSRWLMRALRRSLEVHGVDVRTGTTVLGFHRDGGACRGAITSGGLIRAAAVVDAAGPWAGFDPALPFEVAVHPVRGQIVALLPARGRLSVVVESDEAYVVPRPDGSLLVGATVENVGFEKAVTVEGVRELLSAGTRLLASLTTARFAGAWAGLRPGTPDGLPVLGGCEVPGLFFATGHFRSGILLAPVTALRLADVLTGGSPEGLEAFSVHRFARAVLEPPPAHFS